MAANCGDEIVRRSDERGALHQYADKRSGSGAEAARPATDADGKTEERSQPDEGRWRSGSGAASQGKEVKTRTRDTHP